MSKATPKARRKLFNTKGRSKSLVPYDTGRESSRSDSASSITITQSSFDRRSNSYGSTLTPSSHLSRVSGSPNPEDLSGAITDISPEPVHITSASFIFTGRYRNKKVALKVLQPQEGEGKAEVLINTQREMHVWLRLDHENIMPFYGFDQSFSVALGGAMVYPWYENGHVRDYISSRVSSGDVVSDEERLRLVAEVSDGLAYLHGLGLIHGDPKPENVLVDENGVARLADFGVTHFQQEFIKMGHIFQGPTPRYCAPELISLDQSVTAPTQKSDIYSLGSMALELVLGIIPYQGIEDYTQIIISIFRGVKPAKPPANEHSERSDASLWTLIESCWDPIANNRPNASEFLREISISRIKRHISYAPNLSGRVTKDAHAVFEGIYSDVYKGSYKGQMVAIKVLRRILDDTVIVRRSRREREVWWQLVHPNIWPLLGYVDGKEFGKFGAFVSPWSQNGNASDYMKGRKVGWAKRVTLWLDVAYGVAFLHQHTPPIIHGDLKPLNVLVDHNGTAKLCDFGLVRQTKQGLTTFSTHIGTTLYSARELLDPDDNSGPTTASDVYALGCIGYEFIYGQRPYQYTRKGEYAIISMILNRHPPAKAPSGISNNDEISGLWRNLEGCWSIDIDARPDAKSICRYLVQYGQTLAAALGTLLKAKRQPGLLSS